MRGFLILYALLFSQFCVYAQNWLTLDGAPNKYLNCFYDDTVTGKLFVAGTYSLIGGNDYRGIATWNGAQWDSLGAGIDDNFSSFPGNTNSVVRFGNDILIGGVFSRVGSIASKAMARWDGTQWSTMYGGQPSDAVDGIVINNGELYVNGMFDSIGNVSAHGIAKWNGSSWVSLYGNYDFNNAQDGIRKMIFYHNTLYVSGMFRDPWGTLCRLAKWNGSSWQFMVTDVQGSIAYIADMVVYNDELIVGGLFYQSSGNRANSIMKWNDTLWTDVGGSIVPTTYNPYPTVKDLEVHNNVLYCVGNFEIIGGISANGLASWDGINWCGYDANFELTPGQSMGAICIGFYNDTMYVGGGFHYANGDSIPFLAKWIGGSFVDTCGNTTGLIDYSLQQQEILVYPNPASSVTTFQFSSYASRVIIITDQLGRDIWRQESNDNQIAISVSDLAEGIYFYTIQDTEGSKSNGKFVVSH